MVPAKVERANRAVFANGSRELQSRRTHCLMHAVPPRAGLTVYKISLA